MGNNVSKVIAIAMAIGFIILVSPHGNVNATQQTYEKVVETKSTSSTSTDTYVERTEGDFKYGYKDGRYGFWTPSGNFIEDKSRAISGEDPKEPFMRDGDFYSQL